MIFFNNRSLHTQKAGSILKRSFSITNKHILVKSWQNKESLLLYNFVTRFAKYCFKGKIVVKISLSLKSISSSKSLYWVVFFGGGALLFKNSVTTLCGEECFFL